MIMRPSSSTSLLHCNISIAFSSKLKVEVMHLRRFFLLECAPNNKLSNGLTANEHRFLASLTCNYYQGRHLQCIKQSYFRR